MDSFCLSNWEFSKLNAYIYAHLSAYSYLLIWNRIVVLLIVIFV